MKNDHVQLAISIVSRQLTTRGPLPDRNIAAILQNAFQTFPGVRLDKLPGEIIVLAGGLINRRQPTGVWSLAVEDELVYAASKPGGVKLSDLSKACRVYFNANRRRLTTSALAVLQNGTICSKTDPICKDDIAIIRDHAHGYPVSKATPAIVSALEAGRLVCVHERLWAAPSGPEFSKECAAVWANRHLVAEESSRS
jgi:hypothetical protein